MLKKIAVFHLLFLANQYVFAQTTRNNYNARYELNDHIYHGAGQSYSDFQSYYNKMPKHHKPSMYMHYVSLKSLTSGTWSTTLKSNLASFGNDFVIPQIGVSMTVDGDPNQHYEDDVAIGKYDQQIDYLIEGLKELDRPVFLRIGYEFNGSAWNGYQASTYVASFKRITDKIRVANIEVATVWCFSADGDADFTSFYPGDSYVDWWAIDIFSAEGFTSTKTVAFMNSAHSASKPVMIGESTPRFVGADDDQDWDNWFKDYFNFIDNYPGIKASCYISWDWSNTPWPTWGNAIIGTNDLIRVLYTHHLRERSFFNAKSESETRKLFSPNDVIAPATPILNETEMNPAKPFLKWNTSNSVDTAHYIIYKNGSAIGTTSTNQFTDISAKAGQSFGLAVSAIDLAGNESPKSASYSFELSTTIIKNTNPNFEIDNSFWSLNTFEGAQASLSHSNKSATIRLDQSTGTNWHTQLVQATDIKAGNTYYIEIEAYASSSTTIEVVLQQNHSPYGLLIDQQPTLSETLTTIKTPIVTATTDDTMNIAIFLGQVSQGIDITISSIKLYEISESNTANNNTPIAIIPKENITVDTGELHLNGSSSFDSDGIINSYKWAQISGPNLAVTSGDSTPDFMINMNKEGIYIVRLTVTDDKGAIGTDEIEIKVTGNSTDIKPVALFTATPITGTAPLRVLLDASASSTPNDENLTYSWDLGNGNTATTVTTSATYTQVGEFIISLTVINEDGKSDSATKIIKVIDADTNCGYGTPILETLASINTQYTHINVLGEQGPDLSNITNFTINWSLENNGLYQFSMNTNNGNPNYWNNFLPKIRQKFNQPQPELTLTGTGIPGLDGSYWVTLDSDNFVMVSKTKNFTIYYSKTATTPNCNKQQVETSKTLYRKALMYPNPSRQDFILSLNNTKEVSRIDIYDVMGQKINTLYPLNDKNIQFGKNLLSGIYFINIVLNTKEIITLKAVKTE
ncbi:PKD domain-containing protein [Aquimarina sp. AD10]|uniref:PKD domain-containing protein n=1 Tax=Aquimarina sp. AD10 TaxID=1714849 RepID=UPI000E4D6487|nr:PKD domain-containing protein [Aquimarina sp. AD10]AXT60906.1 PKD domain-containing protein [Aquimarina sp. AD10]RKM95548.1 PKD domain-containing protein [Aquimarina sp. AD10]